MTGSAAIEDRDLRISRLRIEYADLHEEAMRRIRSGCSDMNDLDDIQQRETAIEVELRLLGTRLGAGA